MDGLQKSEVLQKFKPELGENMPSTLPADVTEHWESSKATMKKVCNETLGTEQRKHPDWLDQNDSDLRQLINRKRTPF